MIKTICNICGKEMPTETFRKSIKDFNFCISSYGRAWDICDKCRERLNKVMNELKQKSEG